MTYGPRVVRTEARGAAVAALVAVVLLAVASLWLAAPPAASDSLAAPVTTPTPYPLYLPLVARRVDSVRATATPGLPPPITPTPVTGYVCALPPDGAQTCWASARFSLSRGPGPVCGVDMSIAYYLVSDRVNLEVYTGQYVQARGMTEEGPPQCPPLLRVAEIQPLP